MLFGVVFDLIVVVVCVLFDVGACRAMCCVWLWIVFVVMV